MVMAVLSAFVAAPASASTGGTAFGGSDVAAPPAPPVASSVTCRTGCGSLTTARPGSAIRVLGSKLAGVTQVVFTGGKGPADDASAPAAVAQAPPVGPGGPQGPPPGPVRRGTPAPAAPRP